MSVPWCEAGYWGQSPGAECVTLHSLEANLHQNLFWAKLYSEDWGLLIKKNTIVYTHRLGRQTRTHIQGRAVSECGRNAWGTLEPEDSSSAWESRRLPESQDLRTEV